MDMNKDKQQFWETLTQPNKKGCYNWMDGYE